MLNRKNTEGIITKFKNSTSATFIYILNKFMSFIMSTPVYFHSDNADFHNPKSPQEIYRLFEITSRITR